jgi:acyl-CoA carboxylase epsilon subunit
VTERPVLKVISGDATPEEIAAVVAAVAASGGPPSSTTPTATSIWAQRGSVHRHIRAMFVPSPHAWRTSFWPR